MRFRFALHVIALFAAFCVAMSSVASAARMAPEPSPPVEMQAFLDAGGSLADICSTDDADHTDHDCPFCRLFADPDDLKPIPAAWTLIPRAHDLRLTDITSHNQRHTRDVAVRGPPCLA